MTTDVTLELISTSNNTQSINNFTFGGCTIISGTLCNPKDTQLTWALHQPIPKWTPDQNNSLYCLFFQNIMAPSAVACYRSNDTAVHSYAPTAVGFSARHYFLATTTFAQPQPHPLQILAGFTLQGVAPRVVAPTEIDVTKATSCPWIDGEDVTACLRQAVTIASNQAGRSAVNPAIISIPCGSFILSNPTTTLTKSAPVSAVTIRSPNIEIVGCGARTTFRLGPINYAAGALPVTGSVLPYLGQTNIGVMFTISNTSNVTLKNFVIDGNYNQIDANGNRPNAVPCENGLTQPYLIGVVGRPTYSETAVANVDNVLIDGLQIRDTSCGAVAFAFSISNSGVINSNFHNIGYAPNVTDLLQGADNVVLFFGNRDPTLHPTSDGANFVVNSYFENFAGNSVQVSFNGLAQTKEYGLLGTLIYRNVFNCRMDILYAVNWPVYSAAVFNTYNTGLSIINNIMYASSGDGIDAVGDDRLLVAGNNIGFSGSTAISIFGNEGYANQIVSVGQRNPIVTFNTLINNDQWNLTSFCGALAVDANANGSGSIYTTGLFVAANNFWNFTGIPNIYGQPAPQQYVGMYISNAVSAATKGECIRQVWSKKLPQFAEPPSQLMQGMLYNSFSPDTAPTAGGNLNVYGACNFQIGCQ